MTGCITRVQNPIACMRAVLFARCLRDAPPVIPNVPIASQRSTHCEWYEQLYL